MEIRNFFYYFVVIVNVILSLSITNMKINSSSRKDMETLKEDFHLNLFLFIASLVYFSLKKDYNYFYYC